MSDIKWLPDGQKTFDKLMAAVPEAMRDAVDEEAQRAQEVLLKDVLDSLTAHIAVLDRRGTITLVNANWQRFAEQNGGDRACLPRRNYLAICNRVVSGQDGVEAQDAALRGIQQVLARTKGAFTLTYPCDSPTEPRWFEMRVLPLSGPKPGAVIAHEGITARMSAQESLRTSEQRLQRVLEGANDGFWDWNLTTGELLVSPRWVQMLGYDQSGIEPHARGWERLVHPDDLPRVRQEVQAHCSGATERYQSEHRMLTKQGDWCWVQARAKITLRDAAGQPCVWPARTDITDRRHAEEALRMSLATVQRHDAQMVALNQMNDLLLSCRSREEAYAIIGHSAAALFAPLTGALAVVDDAGADLRRVAAWGRPDGLPPTFLLHDCWALRRGQPHEVQPAQADIDCRHFSDRPPPTYLCIPLNVRGTTLGLLHISADEALTPARFQELRILTITVSESIKLALSNIKSQETLRDWEQRR